MPKELIAKGTGASPGTATGQIVFHAADAVAFAKDGKPVIFVRIETTAEDVPGMQAAAGILTTRGGITGDAAIVARTLGKPCIASCAQMRVDYNNGGSLTVLRDSAQGEDLILAKGATVTIDGAKGEIWTE
jgi:pyruvate,orthophosphate dikinase